MSGTGIVVRSLLEFEPRFRTEAASALRFSTPLVVEAVVAGSPAERAGLQPGDGLVQIDGRRFPLTLPSADQPAALKDLYAGQELLESQRPEQTISIEVRRAGRTISLPLSPIATCRTRFVLTLGERDASDADGFTVRVGAKLLERLSDAGLAVVLAHELAHNILHHPAELDRLKVKQGLGAEFGRSARETLRTEDEADRLSVQLLARAGYDPMSVANFWRGEGRALVGILPRGPSHRGWSGRAALAEQEARRLLDGANQPTIDGSSLRPGTPQSRYQR